MSERHVDFSGLPDDSLGQCSHAFRLRALCASAVNFLLRQPSAGPSFPCSRHHIASSAWAGPVVVSSGSVLAMLTSAGQATTRPL